MPGLIPEHPTAAQQRALLAMLPPLEQVHAAQRGDVLWALSLCGTDEDRIKAFYRAVIEYGGTWLPPLDDRDGRTRRGNHQHEIDMLGTYGCGPSALAAIEDWRKAAERMEGAV